MLSFVSVRLPTCPDFLRQSDAPCRCWRMHAAYEDRTGVGPGCSDQSIEPRHLKLLAPCLRQCVSQAVRRARGCWICGSFKGADVYLAVCPIDTRKYVYISESIQRSMWHLGIFHYEGRRCYTVRPCESFFFWAKDLAKVYFDVVVTSSTAQGGGGSFKNRKPIGEVGCCESDARTNPLMDRKVVGVVFFGVVAMIAVVTSPQLLDVVWSSAVVVVV